MTYQPPYTISSRAVALVAEIAARVERQVIQEERADALKLRRVNRLRSIHSSLAIEGNTLSLNQVTDILDGKRVVAPLREIQEVKNAIATYDCASSLDPFSVADLLKAHGMMMSALVDGAGCFRTGGVGVFSGDQVVHIAPPSGQVPQLVASLFDWLRNSLDHLLIRSCVFHYEFEFIHPFADGNGRTGRLWQSLILGMWNPLFLHLPVETMVHDNQQGYHEAIQQSTEKADSGPFIDFMLERILEALQQQLPENAGGVSGGVSGGVTGDRVLVFIQGHPGLRAKGLSEALAMPQRTLERHLHRLRQEGKIEFRGAPRSGGYYCR